MIDKAMQWATVFFICVLATLVLSLFFWISYALGITVLTKGPKMSKPKAVIYVEGGVINWIASDSEIEVLVVDSDNKGTADGQTEPFTFLNGDTTNAEVGEEHVFVDKGFVHNSFDNHRGYNGNPQ